MTRSTDTGDRMTERVATLLKQAEDFRRHGEDGSADAALALAQKIMLKHDIDAAVAASRMTTDERESIVTAPIPFEGIYRVALAPQFNQLVQAYATASRTFISRGDKVMNLVIVGPQSEVERVQTLVASLHLQTIGKLNLWWRSYEGRFELSSMEGYKARRQYGVSFVQGATERVERARAAAMSGSEPGTALAVRDRRAEVNAFVDANYRLSPYQTRLRPGHRDAVAAGHRDGRQANTGETSVRTDRRSIEG